MCLCTMRHTYDFHFIMLDYDLTNLLNRGALVATTTTTTQFYDETATNSHCIYHIRDDCSFAVTVTIE